MNLLDKLISKTVHIAIEKGIIKSNSIIVYATHTKSRYNLKEYCDKATDLQETVIVTRNKMKNRLPYAIILCKNNSSAFLRLNCCMTTFTYLQDMC